MKSMKILKLEHGYTAIVDDQFFAYGLTPDEVLGVLASSLFGNGRPLFCELMKN